MTIIRRYNENVNTFKQKILRNPKNYMPENYGQTLYRPDGLVRLRHRLQYHCRGLYVSRQVIHEIDRKVVAVLPALIVSGGDEAKKKAAKTKIVWYTVGIGLVFVILVGVPMIIAGMTDWAENNGMGM